jgi:hypothetical protein
MSHLLLSNASVVPQATGLQPKPSSLQPNGVAAHGAHFTGLEDIADTPLSPIEDIADTPKSPPPEDAAPPASRPASAGTSVWQQAHPKMSGLTAAPAQGNYVLHVEASAGAIVLQATDPWLHHSGISLLQLAVFALQCWA